METPPAPAEPAPFRPQRSGPGRTATVWALILAVCGFFIWLHGRQAPPAAAAGEVILELQAKQLVGQAQLLPGHADLVYGQARGMLDIGTVTQRQGFVVLAAELAGPAEAAERLEALDELIADPPRGPPPQLTERQKGVQRILHALFPPQLTELDADAAQKRTARAAEALDDAQRRTLREALGWLGELAAARPGTDAETRRALLRSAAIAAGVFSAGLVTILLAAVVGFIGLIAAALLAFNGRVPSGMRTGPGGAGVPHVVYAETFLIWLVLFFGMQELASFAPTRVAQFALLGAGFFGSLVALGYPVMRGYPWSAVREDVGLTAGGRPWLEPVLGVFGYVLTLPLLAVGFIVTLVLLTLGALLAGEGETFTPAGGPAHPIIIFLREGSWTAKLLVVLLAAVAAPVVEEIAFRGVLYRHLRGATGEAGTAGSIVISTAVNTFMFAAIHPQGFVAVPLLMLVATGLTLLREWRGTLVPSMVLHGVVNGLAMGLLLFLLNV